MPASTIPPEASENQITPKGNGFNGPGGKFATKKNAGLFNVGTTSISDFLKANPALFTGGSPSLTRIMDAVSENEGKLEAVNSYDNAFMSFGIMQWTAGADAAAGELADLLNRIKTTKPAAFTEYFGKFKLDVKMGPEKAGTLRTGFLTLDGQPLNTAARKAELRKPIWGYRFWRAGHDTDVRACEVEQAMARIDVFYRTPRTALGGKAISDYVTSEYGVALLLDQHVNRPGHVPATLVTAIKAFGKKDPATWQTADERAVIALYIKERANTSMTNSTKRANSIKAAVTAGTLSDQRGSFA